MESFYTNLTYVITISLGIVTLAYIILRKKKSTFQKGNASQCPSSNPQWMSKLHGETSISMLSIPGTHDSMTYYFQDSYPKKLLKSFTQCQTLTIEQQLNIGIRFLDIRCNNVGKEIKMYHGPVDLDSVALHLVSPVKTFMQENEKEFLIIRLKQESSKRPDFGDILFGEKGLLHELEELLWQPKKESVHIPKVSDIRGKILILQDYGEEHESTNAIKYGLKFNNEKLIILADRYRVHEGLRAITEGKFMRKWSNVKDNIQTAAMATHQPHKKPLYCTFTSANSGSNLEIQSYKYWHLIPFGKPSEIAVYMNQQTYDYLDELEKEKIGLKMTTGIIAMDFPEFAPQLVETIIRLNSSLHPRAVSIMNALELPDAVCLNPEHIENLIVKGLSAENIVVLEAFDPLLTILEGISEFVKNFSVTTLRTQGIIEHNAGLGELKCIDELKNLYNMDKSKFFSRLLEDLHSNCQNTTRIKYLIKYISLNKKAFADDLRKVINVVEDKKRGKANILDKYGKKDECYVIIRLRLHDKKTEQEVKEAMECKKIDFQTNGFSNLVIIDAIDIGSIKLNVRFNDRWHMQLFLFDYKEGILQSRIYAWLKRNKVRCTRQSIRLEIEASEMKKMESYLRQVSFECLETPLPGTLPIIEATEEQVNEPVVPHPPSFTDNIISSIDRILSELLGEGIIVQRDVETLTKTLSQKGPKTTFEKLTKLITGDQDENHYEAFLNIVSRTGQQDWSRAFGSKTQEIKSIKVPAKGGLYYMKNADTMIAIQNNTLSSSTEFIVISRPSSGSINIDEANILSEMITILPHNTVFNQHVLVKFPLAKSKLHQDDPVELLYSQHETNGEYNWIRLQQHDTSCQHSDDIFWLIDSEYCYLYVRHCCHFILIKQSGKEEQEALQLCTSVHAMWNKNGFNDLEIAVGFHCPKCNKINLTNQSQCGVLLTCSPKYIIRGSGPVTISVELQDEMWSDTVIREEISNDILMLQCNPDLDMYFQRFLFLAKQENVDLNKTIRGTVNLSQQGQTQGAMRFVTRLGKLMQMKSLVETATNTDTSLSEYYGETNENRKTTVESGIKTEDQMLDTREELSFKQTSKKNIVAENEDYFSCDDSDETDQDDITNLSKKSLRDTKHELTCATGVYDHRNTTNIQIITGNFYHPTNFPLQYANFYGLPIQPKTADCIFNESILFEQTKLCNILDNDCKEKLSAIAKAVGDLSSTVDRKNITGLSLLQVWHTHVQSNKCTWKQFYDILLKLNCETAAQQLKVVYEKDKLLCELKKLRQFLRLKDISATLVSEDIIDVSERSFLLNMGDENKAVEHFVLEFLIRRDYKFLAKFHKVLSQDRYHTEWISELVLCPEELE